MLTSQSLREELFRVRDTVPFIADQGGGSHIVGADGPGVGASVLGAGRQEKRVAMVPAVSLDEYFRDKEPPSFIKLDVEGEELSALRGAEELLPPK